MHTVVTALGWVGAVLCLAAYLLVSTGRWQAGSGRYQLANVVSGVLMGAVAAAGGVWPSAATNAVWAVVGLITCLALVRARRRSADTDAPEAATVGPPRRTTLTQPTGSKGNDWTTRAPDRRAHDVDAA
ncbi:CBU_0592 family membrane protein [Cellulomonas soli]|uniref:CBU_0592 family membrane protein n=1 Tax=Cellulomonas soli TaxID=931535 RepID=UPI003F82B8FB